MSVAYLSGKVHHKTQDWVIIENNGIGYKVEMNTEVVQPEQDLSLYIYDYYREDAHRMFGFSSVRDLEMFELILSVSGVGPKTALLIMNQYSADEVAELIRTENTIKLGQISRIGKKTAERIVIDLKGKVEDLIYSDGDETKDPGGPITSIKDIYRLNALQEAVSALKNLGYTDKEIYASVEALPNNEKQELKDLTSELMIKKLLQYLVK